ncbi:MAG: TonB-dependent receptor [Gammaproteobacteria bacterium]|nr:TonB-dependent receptor [Gammaproteobacteria bacterium]
MLLLLCAGVILYPSAWAQEQTQEREADDKDVEEIIVTGSRIKRADNDGPQPVVVFDRVYLQALGVTDIADFGRYLPQSHQTLNESWGQYATGVPEASQFNLRGLGADSTLTLVNGLRIAPYGQSMWGDPFADVSAIPMSAVERIEVLKDGASAIYGADAVAGVVNIILRKDFVGTEVTGGYQVTSRGDNAEWNVNLFHGGQHGRFYYMLGAFYQDRQPLYNRDRKHSADPDFTAIGGYNFRSGNSSPGSFLRYDTFTMHADSACGTDPFISNVMTWEEWPGESQCRFNYNAFDMMHIERQRASASVKAGYDFDNGVHLFADILYSHKDSFSGLAQTPVAGAWLDTILGRPFVPADHPNNPWGTDGELWYRVMDAGPRQKDATSDQYRVALGLEGSMGEWSWSTSLLDSANSVGKLHLNSILLPEFQAALMGQGGPDQNQYYNPFGMMPENDPAVIDGFAITTIEGSDSVEKAVDITASRSFGRLPGGPVGIAIGAQWRYQELEEFADEVSAQGLIAGRSADFLLDHADREIGAAYAELGLPVVTNLELQLAARYEKYSDFGDTTNPKIALRWQAVQQIALRASWGTSFHAPDFLDLYQNPVEYLGRFIDTPRCEATGLDVDCNPAIYDVLDQGNPELQPETGESWYAGLIWKPSFAPDLTIDVGYWRIDYDDKIYWVGGQFVLDNLPVENPYVERAPQTPEEAAAGIPGRIMRVQYTTQNLAQQFTDGWDVDVAYEWQTNSGNDVSLRLDYTYTARWEVVLPEAFGYTEYSRAGWYWDGPIPRNRGNVNLSWRTGRHDLGGTVHYAGHYRNWMAFLPVDGEKSDIPFIVDSHTTLDLQYALHLERLHDATIRFGCQNCTDAAPPFTHDTAGENIHDRRGLIWYANWTQPF